MTPEPPFKTTRMPSSQSDTAALLAKIAELEARVRVLDESNKSLDKQNKKLDEQNKKLDEHNRKLDEHNRKLEVANKALQEELQACLQAAKDMVPTTRAIFRVGKDLLTGDPVEDLELLSVLEYLARDIHRIALEGQRLDHYRRVGRDAATGVAPEASAVTPEPTANNPASAEEQGAPVAPEETNEPSTAADVIKQEVDKPVQELSEELQAKLRDANKMMGAAKKTLRKLDADKKKKTSAAIKAAKGIDDVPEPARKQVARKNSPGRQKAKVNGRKRVVKRNPEGVLICPVCGKPVTSLGEFIRDLKTVLESLQSRCVMHTEGTGIGYCHDCKRAVSSLNEETPVPMSPGNSNTIAQDVVLEGLGLQVEGLPRNAVHRLLYSALQLGHDTMCRNEGLWMDSYGTLLLSRIRAVAQSEAVLIADETPFRCLELENSGAAKLRKEQSEHKGAKSGYVLSICNPENSKHKFVIFNAMIGRSAQSIREQLEPYLTNGQLELLVTDGYEAYDSLLRQADWGVTRAACWTHWRRTVIKAVEYDLFAKQVGKLSVEEAEALFETRLSNENTKTDFLLYIIDGIRKMYAHERSIVQRPGESDESYLARVRKNRNTYARVIVTETDKLIELLKEGVVEYDHKYKRYKAVSKAPAPLAAAITYYLNNRKELAAFLNDPRVPLDTNAIERCIRPVACLEGATKFRQTKAYMQNLCDSFTLFETAKCNGITRPVEYLEKFGRAVYKHCVEKRWTQNFECKGVHPVTRGIRTWNMKALMEDFDVTPWLPWNYEEQPLPEVVK